MSPYENITFNGASVVVGDSPLAAISNGEADPRVIRFKFTNCDHNPLYYNDWHSTNAWLNLGNDIWEYTPYTNIGTSGVTDYYGVIKAREFYHIETSPTYGLLSKARFGENAEIEILSYNTTVYHARTNQNHNSIFQKCDAITKASNIYCCISENYHQPNFEIDFSRLTSIGTSCSRMFSDCTNLKSVENMNLAAYDVEGMFNNCTNLEYIPYFRTNTTSIDNISYAFYNCTKLITIRPIPKISNAICSYAFKGCVNVEDGILDMYNALINTSSSHTECFNNCGINNTSGTYALSQLPSSWK